MIGTCILALLGIAAIVARGSNILDIDFTSGSSVQLQFDPKHPQAVADVRREAQEVLPPGLVVSELRIAGAERGLQFLLNTSNPEINDVEEEAHREVRRQAGPEPDDGLGCRGLCARRTKAEQHSDADGGDNSSPSRWHSPSRRIRTIPDADARH